jgi:Plasmid encoded RepA protein
VPVDMRALRALKRSPLALDLYAWLTFQAYRSHQSGQPRFETWQQLHSHMGGDYAEVDNFRKKVKVALAKIRSVYPGLKLSGRVGGASRCPRLAFRQSSHAIFHADCRL